MMLLVVSIVLAVLCAAITIGASRGTISSNSAIGIRTMATQRSEASWVNAHRAAEPILLLACAVILIGGIIAMTGVTRAWGQLEIQGSVLLGLLLIAIIMAAIAAQRAALRTK